MRSDDQFNELLAKYNALAARVTTLEGFPVASGTYTPTLTNLTIGTGGSPLNGAVYTVQDCGAYMMMTVHGFIQLGSSGFSVGPAPVVISLPAGYAASGSASQPVGNFWILNDTYQNGMLWLYGNGLRCMLTSTSGAYAGVSDLTSAVPSAWAAADQWSWNASLIVQ